jgi:hypothetical protein
MIYGVVGGTDLSKSTSVMAEVHATSRSNFTRDVVTMNFAFRHKLSDHEICIGSLGHDVHPGEGATLAFIGYWESSCFTDQCALDADFCGKIRIKATITISSTIEAV